MKHIAAILALVTAVTPPISAQVQGDSIRLEVPPSREWTRGRLVSLDSSRLTITYLDGNQSYPLQTLGRVEVWRRKGTAGTLLRWTLITEAGTALIILTSPGEKTRTYAGAVALSAGFGLSLGAIELKKYPWTWKRLRFSVKAAT
jgi:hypothetical protein